MPSGSIDLSGSSCGPRDTQGDFCNCWALTAWLSLVTESHSFTSHTVLPGLNFLLMSPWSHHWEGSVTTLPWKINEILAILFLPLTTLTIERGKRKSGNKAVRASTADSRGLSIAFWCPNNMEGWSGVPGSYRCPCWLWLLSDGFPLISPVSNPRTSGTDCSASLFLNQRLCWFVHYLLLPGVNCWRLCFWLLAS